MGLIVCCLDWFWAHFNAILTGILAGIISGLIVSVLWATISGGLTNLWNVPRQRKWGKMIEDAEVFTNAVRGGREMRSCAAAYRARAEKRVRALYQNSGCTLKQCEMDEDVQEWLAQYLMYREIAIERERSFRPEGIDAREDARYWKDYEMGSIFIEWERVMSAEFRESHKTRIENLKALVAAPIRQMEPEEVAPYSLDSEGVVRHKFEDGCTRVLWKGKTVWRGGHCPTGEHLEVEHDDEDKAEEKA